MFLYPAFMSSFPDVGSYSDDRDRSADPPYVAEPTPIRRLTPPNGVVKPEPRPAPTPAPPPPTRWLSIEAACQLLGVDQSTLRRWSDGGKIPVFRTPGGHRRYAEDDLKALVKGDSRGRKRMSRASLTSLSLSAYERAGAESHGRNQPWRHAYDPATLEELRPLGRRLVDLTIRYVSARVEREEILAESRAIGARYGEVSARAGLSTADALEAFLYFRTPVITAVTQHIEDEQVPARRAARVISELTAFMDQVLIATISAHEGQLTDA
jgi:excisionase family DNA binding protein